MILFKVICLYIWLVKLSCLFLIQIYFFNHLSTTKLWGECCKSKGRGGGRVRKEKKMSVEFTDILVSKHWHFKIHFSLIMDNYLLWNMKLHVVKKLYLPSFPEDKIHIQEHVSYDTEIPEGKQRRICFSLEKKKKITIKSLPYNR